MRCSLLLWQGIVMAFALSALMIPPYFIFDPNRDGEPVYLIPPYPLHHEPVPSSVKQKLYVLYIGPGMCLLIALVWYFTYYHHIRVSIEYLTRQLKKNELTHSLGRRQLEDGGCYALIGGDAHLMGGRSGTSNAFFPFIRRSFSRIRQHEDSIVMNDSFGNINSSPNNWPSPSVHSERASSHFRYPFQMRVDEGNGGSRMHSRAGLGKKNCTGGKGEEEAPVKGNQDGLMNRATSLASRRGGSGVILWKISEPFGCLSAAQGDREGDDDFFCPPILTHNAPFDKDQNTNSNRGGGSHGDIQVFPLNELHHFADAHEKKENDGSVNERTMERQKNNLHGKKQNRIIQCVLCDEVCEFQMLLQHRLLEPYLDNLDIFMEAVHSSLSGIQ